jgi:hypothetical protein
VIAFGLALRLLGAYITALTFGWVGYAPLSNSLHAPTRLLNGGLNTGPTLLLWLGLVVVWAAGSLFILRSGRQGDTP